MLARKNPWTKDDLLIDDSRLVVCPSRALRKAGWFAMLGI
jgi:hypothetical protein